MKFTLVSIVIASIIVGSNAAVNFCEAKLCRYYEDGIINALSASAQCININCFYEGIYDDVKFVYKNLEFELEEKSVEGTFRVSLAQN